MDGIRFRSRSVIAVPRCISVDDSGSCFELDCSSNCQLMSRAGGNASAIFMLDVLCPEYSWLLCLRGCEAHDVRHDWR